MTKDSGKSSTYKITVIMLLFGLGFVATIVSICVGTMMFPIQDSLRALFVADDSDARLIIWNLRLPRVLSGGLVGICLALSGCILQGVMRNHLASPTTIGVTSGASFVGHLILVVFTHRSNLLPLGTIGGAFFTTMSIYLLAYNKGVSPVKIVLSGMAVSAVFGAFNDIIRSFFTDRIANVVGFLVGSLNGVSWARFQMVLPYAIVGVLLCFLVPTKMNILMLGDEMANSLGLRTEKFRFFLIAISSLLAGAAISVAGMISFIGLIVPHIARLLVGSDHKYLFPASIALGYTLITICDVIGRVVLPVGELSVSIVVSFVGAPFFLYLLRTRKYD